MLQTAPDRRLSVQRRRPITAPNVGRPAKLSIWSGSRIELGQRFIIRPRAGKEMIVSEKLTYDVLREVVDSAAAFRCRRKLQPAGGEGDKVFPPTYAGAVYATEQRRVPGKQDPVMCVVLDSVQSQANRMEEALQEAIDVGKVAMPLVVVDFSEAKLEVPIGLITVSPTPASAIR